jgi:arylsulfatase A-like enzyme
VRADMKRRDVLKLAGLGAAAMGMPSWLRAAASPADARKPNIILILADDLGYGDVGCYGQAKIKTPNIDRLAAEGIRFTQAYAGCTVCAPSRCCLLTGRHTGHGTVRGNPLKDRQEFALGPEDVTVAKVLKRAGYATAMFGKWGLGDTGSTGLPSLQGFDEFVGYLNHKHAHDPFPEILHTNQGKIDLPGNKDGQQTIYSGDVFTEQAVSFIQRHKDQPFFLYLPYTAGHFQYILQTDEPYTNEQWPQTEKYYAAMLTRMDRSIGRLAELLKELRLDQDTIIFFSSDNGSTPEGGHQPGFFRSNAPLRGIKRDLYEGGIRVPMIARWPGHVRPGTVSDQVWAFWNSCRRRPRSRWRRLPTTSTASPCCRRCWASHNGNMSTSTGSFTKGHPSRPSAWATGRWSACGQRPRWSCMT